MELNKLIDIPQEVIEFLKMENNVYKNLMYERKFNGRSYPEVSICKKEGKIHFSDTQLTIKKNMNKDGGSSFYLRPMKKAGFTIDEKNKLSVWFGKSVFELPHISFFYNYMNYNWLDKNVYPYITKSVLEKMLKHKITNNLDLIASYLKSMRISASPKKFLEVITKIGQNKQNLLRLLSVAKNNDHLLDLFIDNSKNTPGDSVLATYDLEDLIKQAFILGRKIDFTWSQNRIKEEHKMWTREIMAVELNYLEDKDIPLKNFWSAFQHPGYTLLTTQKEVFIEGTTMDHCLYTNYEREISSGQYLAYSVEHNGEKATLGLSIKRHPNLDKRLVAKINQSTGKRNQSISAELRIKNQEFVSALNNHLMKNPVEIPKTVVVEIDDVPF